jgi:hypothetical protein
MTETMLAAAPEAGALDENGQAEQPARSVATFVARENGLEQVRALRDRLPGYDHARAGEVAVRRVI